MTTPHPDDEELSAYLDGEAGAAEAAHVSACPDCRRRLEQLRSAIDAVAAQPPARAAVERDRAVNAALRAVGHPIPEPPPQVVAMRRVGQPRVPGWLLGAAAAVIVLLVAVPLLAGFGHGGGAKASKSSSAQISAGPNRPTSDRVTTTAAITAPTPSTDLGDVLDTTQLVAVTTARRRSVAPADAASGATTTSPAVTAKKTTATTTKAAAATPAGCTDPEGRARAAAGTTSPATFRATLRWQGRPATVTAFPLAAARVALVVVADDDCSVLATTTAG